jgi:hypothetical protein
MASISFVEQLSSICLAGRAMVNLAGLGEWASLIHVADTRSLPFENGTSVRFPGALPNRTGPDRDPIAHSG